MSFYYNIFAKTESLCFIKFTVKDIVDHIVLYAVTIYMDTVNAHRPILPEDKLLLIRFYKCLAIGILIDWLNDGMQYDLARSVSRIDTLFQGATEQAYQAAIRSARENPRM